MTTRHTWRRALAVPAALSLALGGALFGATAASAADGQLVITSPTDGSTTTSRDVDIVGTAVAGASINVFTDSTKVTRIGTTTTDRTTGAFTVDLPVYPETALASQSVYVDGVVGGSGFSDAQTLAFRLPISKFLTVDAPTEGQAFDTRTVTVSGTASQGSTVTVSDAAGELGRQNLGNSTSYSIDVTFADTAAAAQTLTVGGTLGGSGITPVTRSITIPAPVEAPAPAKTVTLDAPAEGDTTDSRTVVFEGTAPEGSTVTVVDEAGAELGRQNLGNGTTFAIEVTYADDADVEQTVVVSGVVGGSGFDNSVTRSFSIPAVVAPEPQPEPIPAPEPIVAPATPVITAPVQDETVVGDRVTFQGTGTPGSDIGLFAVPTDDLAELEAQVEEALAALEPQLSTLAQPSPQPEPVDPTDRIVVGEDGTWSVTLEQLPGDYTVVAFAALFDEDGAVVTDPTTGLPVVSGLSTPVEYSLVAAVVPAGTTPVAVVPADSALAYTGTELSGVALGLAGALTLAGVALTLVARRRRALEAVAAE